MNVGSADCNFLDQLQFFKSQFWPLPILILTNFIDRVDSKKHTFSMFIIEHGLLDNPYILDKTAPGCVMMRDDESCKVFLTTLTGTLFIEPLYSLTISE